MSLFGGDSSSSSSTQISTQNTGTSNGGVAASQGSVVNVLDAGALANAADLSKAAITKVSDTANGAFNLADTLGSNALDLAGKVNDSALQTLQQEFSQSLNTLNQGYQQNVATVSQVLAKQTLDSGTQISSLLQQLVLYGGIALILVYWISHK